MNKPCLFQDNLRYSLESLGFDVSGIVENIVKEKIQWSNDLIPKYVTCISALLSNECINLNDIVEILNNK